MILGRQATETWAKGTLETINRTRTQQYLPDVVRSIAYSVNRQKSSPHGLMNGKALVLASQLEYVLGHINEMMETIGDLQGQLEALQAERVHLKQLPPSASPRCNCGRDENKPEWITVKQYAQKYGMSVHAVNGRRRRKNAPLPARKVAGKPWEVLDVPC